MTETHTAESRLSKFSFNEPSTFHLANDQQRDYLLSILEEFSLDHLAESDRKIAKEALRRSGVEVHNGCEIERRSNGSIHAFFRRWRPHEHRFYHPLKGVLNLNKSEDSPDGDPVWQPQNDDLTEFAYPFAEPQVVPKSVPVNLSSMRITSRTDNTIRFTGSPSALLVAKIPDDNIVEIKDLVVDFEVDTSINRVSHLQLRLREPLRVHRGIRLNELTVNFKFGEDSVTGRNVLTHTDQYMQGRLWALFRPQLKIETELTYRSCTGVVPSESYLFESMQAIQRLAS